MSSSVGCLCILSSSLKLRNKFWWMCERERHLSKNFSYTILLLSFNIRICCYFTLHSLSGQNKKYYFPLGYYFPFRIFFSQKGKSSNGRNIDNASDVRFVKFVDSNTNAQSGKHWTALSFVHGDHHVSYFAVDKGLLSLRF